MKMKTKLLAIVIAAFTATTAQADAKFGDWIFSPSVNPTTLENTSAIFTTAIAGENEWGETPFMAVRCDTVVFGNLGFIGHDGASVLIREESESKASRNHGNRSTDFKAIMIGNFNKNFWKERYKKEFQNSMREQKLHATVQPYGAPQLTMTFSMKGFSQAITKLAQTCSK